MTTATVAPPTPSEYAPFYGGYVGRVAGRDPLTLLVGQLDELERLLAPLTRGQALARYAPEKWSVTEVVGHLADAERIFSYRALRIARGDATPLAGFDENAYVRAANFDRRGLPAVFADLGAVRQATLALVRGFAPEDLERQGSANGHPIAVRALVHIMAGHTDHHLDILRTRYGLG